MRRSSQRFTPGWRSKYLVPAVLVTLLLVLVATLLVVILSVLGFIPGG